MDIDAEELRALRFQYDVIKGQSDSIRAMTSALMEQQKTLGEINERLIRIESNKVDSRVTDLEADVEQLKAERQQRAGMAHAFELVLKSPLVGWLVGAAGMAWLFLSGKVTTQ